MLRRRLRSIRAFVLIMAVMSCGRPSAGDRPPFRLLSPAQTGVTFANTIATTDSVNVQTDVYLYNGGGVAVGDIDNDGLPDIFFAGNMVSSRLYLNKGNMRFEDITESAGIKTDRWATGAYAVTALPATTSSIATTATGHSPMYRRKRGYCGSSGMDSAWRWPT